MKNTSLITLILSLGLLAAGTVHSEDKAPTAAKTDDKVDISDLENKYWAPKDTDFSVVQNRTYSKTHRWFASIEYGQPVNDQYSTGNLYGLAGNYFFSERYGVQINYIHGDLHNNQETNDLANFGSGVQPDHGRMLNNYSIGFDYVPFYAKMSFLGKRVIYFDMAITPTIGLTNYQQIEKDGNGSKEAFTYGVDITQYFFLNNWFAIRADLKNQWYTQDVVKYQATDGLAEGAPVANKMIHDILFLMGATFYF